MYSSLRYFHIALLIILSDQASKYWAYTRLRLGSDLSVIHNFLKLSYAENPGIAFGMFSDSSGALKVWALAIISVIAIGLVVYFAMRSMPGKRVPLIALMLVLGGIIGNLIDRVRLGVVIDFIELYIGQYHWPTFNLADAAICVGALLLSVDILRESKDATESAHSDDQPKEGASD